MGLVPIILNYFLKPQECRPLLVTKILGFLLLMIAAVTGLYFLFQFLVPLIGYIESGAVLTLILATGGSVLLSLNTRKKPHSHHDVIISAKEILKELQVDQFIKQNSYKIILVSFVTGLVFSQFKDVKIESLNKLYAQLKKNWPFD